MSENIKINDFDIDLLHIEEELYINDKKDKEDIKIYYLNDDLIEFNELEYKDIILNNYSMKIIKLNDDIKDFCYKLDKFLYLQKDNILNIFNLKDNIEINNIYSNNNEQIQIYYNNKIDCYIKEENIHKEIKINEIQNIICNKIKIIVKPSTINYDIKKNNINLKFILKKIEVDKLDILGKITEFNVDKMIFSNPIKYNDTDIIFINTNQYYETDIMNINKLSILSKEKIILKSIKYIDLDSIYSGINDGIIKKYRNDMVKRCNDELKLNITKSDINKYYFKGLIKNNTKYYYNNKLINDIKGSFQKIRYNSNDTKFYPNKNYKYYKYSIKPFYISKKYGIQLYIDKLYLYNDLYEYNIFDLKYFNDDNFNDYNDIDDDFYKKKSIKTITFKAKPKRAQIVESDDDESDGEL